MFGSLPFELDIPIPFTAVTISPGGDNLEAVRAKVRRRPNDPDARWRLGMLLLRQEPHTQAHLEEAAVHFHALLALLPAGSDENENSNLDSWRAMVHVYLGDIILGLGLPQEARRHWQTAFDIDPVRPPSGFSGWAQTRLEKYAVD